MKLEIYSLIAAIVTTGNIFAQSPPSTGSGNANSDFWSRSANNQTTGGNVFGTRWNSPIYTYTGGLASTNARMKVNSIFSGTGNQYTINGYGWNQGVNTTGYVLIGADGTSISGGSQLYNDKGAFSLLHLNGATASNGFQEFGYRPWMQTGITLTGNRDLSYFGLRQLGTGEDNTETTIAWSDNPTEPNPGPDDMVFRFTSGAASTVTNTDFSANGDYDGLHVARFTGNGRMGVGNTFGINVGSAVNYNSPQSLLHMSYQFRTGTTNQPYGFMQITYRRANGAVADIIGQGESSTDGLRLGIDNVIQNSGSLQHLNGYLRWQEPSSFIIQTEDDKTPSIQNNERMRVTSTGALALTQGLNYGGDTLPRNLTRIGISREGNLPVTQPQSLLHLGYNLGGNLSQTPNLALNDGWRRWMDLGMFTTNRTDYVFIGLKPHEELPTDGNLPINLNDNMDAVIAWGDNEDSTSTAFEPDVMRFIFTSNEINPAESVVSRSYNGLEVMRLYPGYDSTFYYGQGSDSLRTYGRVGIGDFTFQGVNEQPTHKLDVVGNGRFRFLPDSLYLADSTVNKIVMVDSMGVLRWTTYVPSQFGVECSDTVNGTLQNDSKVNLNNFNFYFENADSTGTNHVGIGMVCGTPLPAKLTVYNDDENIGAVVLSNSPVFGGTNRYGLSGVAENAFVPTGLNGLGRDGVRVIGTAGNGVNGEEMTTGTTGYGLTTTGNGSVYGGQFGANGASELGNYGVSAEAKNSDEHNIGGYFYAESGPLAIGVYGEAAMGTTNYAGYFAGPIVQNQPSIPSDAQFKDNINSINNANDVLSALNPVTYEYVQTGNAQYMHFPSNQQYGLIAQDVEQVIPNIVSTVIHPEKRDTSNNVITPSFDYKTVQYNALIPILISGHQQQNEMLDSLQVANDSLQNQINDLNDRLSNLENCLSGILPFLCQLSNSEIQPTQENVQDELRAIIDINLSDKNTIVLNQNVPNPFAESTVITYSVPATVQKAQIHFYDMSGILINSVDITERGEGQINVYANDLSSGIYTYTLVADGQIVATKKMMKR